ncbi:PREDICTED: PERQ amino acid-rich with GYF domain-containing protein 2-like [Theobroma cacao]|uniref:PERQ amino acid-rich with GYF domain-containing protein 2-like n=1 Tax=Theobroma cacao TaxID=3641 RepID=A0AB32WEJ9_THECC|nr:PREDICTED: PERQ amino acid-rich with GYF domain-containing protein 2-like [Theobroma cacao]
MTHRLNTLEFAYGESGFLKRIEEIARAWKKTSRVDQGRYTDEVTTEYQIWHVQQVKDVVYPKEDALRGLVDPKQRDALLESELARKKSEAENANWKQRELQREIQVRENRGDELQAYNDGLRNQVRFQQKSIQLLRQEYEELEGVMMAYQQEYGRLKQESTRIREWGESYKQAYIEKHDQMDYLVWQMREVAYKARSMAWKTDILRSQVFPIGKQEQQLIKYLGEVPKIARSPKPSDQRVHNTRQRSRIMEEKQREQMDRMERAQEEMRKQLAKMMELMTSLSKGKNVAEESAPLKNPPAQDIGNQRDDPPYPLGFTPPHAQTS